MTFGDHTENINLTSYIISNDGTTTATTTGTKPAMPTTTPTTGQPTIPANV